MPTKVYTNKKVIFIQNNLHTSLIYFPSKFSNQLKFHWLDIL